MHTRRLLAGPLAAIAATSIAPSANCQPITQQQRPNIILFLVDDMGWQDTSVPFDTVKSALNTRFHTPSMERLVKRGTKFTQAYACSISSPSRCSLMTGMNQARHCVTNWTFGYNTATDEADTALIIPKWNVNGIQPVAGIEHSAEATSFVQLLNESGYRTIHVGKGHFGSIGTPSANPSNYGFDINIAGHAAGGLASYLGEERYGHDSLGRPTSRFSVPGLEKYWDTNTFVTEALTLEAIAALDSIRISDPDVPFFLYMSHYAVHVPIQPDQRFIQKYIDAGLDPLEAAYASLIEGMDKSLGDLLDYIEQHDLADNTIVIFMSDNGGLSALGRTPPLGHQNAPLRSGKGSAYEGGIREPMIVSWPGVTEGGSEIKDYIIIEDFFPTILEMAGITGYDIPQIVDGQSFVPLLKDSTATGHARERALVWNTPNIWISGNYRDHGIGATAAIRKGNYKLIYWYVDGRKELYDLSRDLGEQHDISVSYPEIVRALSSQLADYLRGAGAQRPFYKTTGKPCPWPDEV